MTFCKKKFILRLLLKEMDTMPVLTVHYCLLIVVVTPVSCFICQQCVQRLVYFCFWVCSWWRAVLQTSKRLEEICVRWERVACWTWRPLPVVHRLSLPWPQAPPETTRTPRQGASLITSESLPVSLDDLCPGLTPLICHFIPSALASLLANMSPGVLKPLHCLYA